MLARTADPAVVSVGRFKAGKITLVQRSAEGSSKAQDKP